MTLTSAFCYNCSILTAINTNSHFSRNLLSAASLRYQSKPNCTLFL